MVIDMSISIQKQCPPWVRIWLREYLEEDGTIAPVWCQGMVVAAKSNKNICFEWGAMHLCLWSRHREITNKRLMISKWKKDAVQGWRLANDSIQRIINSSKEIES